MKTLKINRTKSAEIKKLAQAYILDAIDGEAYDKQLNTDEEKLRFLCECFENEYLFFNNLRRYGSYQAVLREWIMGLPSVFNIDFENYRIVEIAKQWGSLPANATEDQEWEIIENWFNYIAVNTMQLMGKYHIYPRVK